MRNEQSRNLPLNTKVASGPLGEIYLAAFYDKELSSSEVDAHFASARRHPRGSWRNCLSICTLGVNSRRW